MGRGRTASHGHGISNYSYLHEKSGLTFACTTNDNSRYAKHDRPIGRRLFVANRERGKWVWMILHHDGQGCADNRQPFTGSVELMRGPWASMDEAIGDMLWYESESGGEIGL